ncbi:MAG: DUF3458 domain-containing protein, partial [Synechococcaceae bacterium WB7_3xG_012]|nr:DUF3458 domain-containing protein [Synechococcaceae bacterium WB7_3xG_012]
VAAGDAAIRAEAAEAVSGPSMTLARAGLRALQSIESPERSAALQAFHDRWQDKPVILDAWFALEASAPFADGLEPQDDELVVMKQYPSAFFGTSLASTLTAMGVGTGADGLRLGRQLFTELPEHNRLRRHHEQRWAIDCAADANFADMYLHPQETSYNLERLMAFVASADLDFAGFSNPEVWDPARLLKGELLERAQALPPEAQWRLVEDLDPDISHFEFFLSKGPVQKQRWDEDSDLLAALGCRNPCLWGWPGRALLDSDMAPLDLSAEGFSLLQALEQAPADTPLGQLPLDWSTAQIASVARELQLQRVLLLRSGPGVSA